LSEILDLEKIDKNYFSSKKTVVVIGFFDGVHLGHRKIINECIKRAKKLDICSIVLTFDKPPLNVIKRGTYKKLIIPYESKIKIINSMGVDHTVVASIGQDFLKLTPEEFCRNILIDRLNIKEIFVGEGFRFGINATGNISFMKDFFKVYGIIVNVVPLLKVKGEIVSSTTIRKYYSEGRIKEISELLGRNPQVEGNVIKGAGRGRKLGFPTANIDIGKFFITPADGVYLGRVLIKSEDNSIFPAVVNVGNNPTFKESKKWIEAFLLGFSGSIYSKQIEITFLKKIRDEIKFGSKSDLINRIELDLKYARKYFNIKSDR
jgi:riboflavin kinase / FMN adenylyltransferase